METTLDTFPWMFGAYLVYWGVLSLYIVSIAKRVRNLEKKSGESSKL